MVLSISRTVEKTSQLIVRDSVLHNYGLHDVSSGAPSENLLLRWAIADLLQRGAGWIFSYLFERLILLVVTTAMALCCLLHGRAARARLSVALANF